MPFGIVYLARIVSNPSSCCVLPLAFVVAPTSHDSSLPTFVVAIRVVFAAPPSFAFALPLKYVVVDILSLIHI